MIARNDLEVDKAKGVNLKLRHKGYADVLIGRKVVRHKMKRTQSKLHSVGSYDFNKISLSCFDDKRYVLDDGINTLAYGHKNIVSWGEIVLLIKFNYFLHIVDEIKLLLMRSIIFDIK